MKTIVLLLVFVAISVFAYCDPTSEITQLLKDQDAAWNRGDLDGFVAPYDDSGKLVFVSTVIIHSPKELKERYEKRYKTADADFGKLTFSELQVEELAPGFARAWGKWSVETKEKTSSGFFTLILQKRDGHWHIIHDHSS